MTKETPFSNGIFLMINIQRVCLILIIAFACSFAAALEVQQRILNFASERLGLGTGNIVIEADQQEELVSLIEYVVVKERVPVMNPYTGKWTTMEQMRHKPKKRNVCANKDYKMIVKNTKSELFRVIVAEDYGESLAATAFLFKCQPQADSKHVDISFAQESDLRIDWDHHDTQFKLQLHLDHRDKVDLSSLKPEGPINFFPITAAEPLIWSCPQEKEKKRSLKVMSVNLWNHNHWEIRKDILREELSTANADLIGFQEVRSRKISHQSTARFQVNDLQDILPPGYEFVFQPAMMFQEESSGQPELVQEGLAIFSRIPVLSADYLKLSRDPRDEADFHQRLCLRTLLQTSFGPIYFMSTHLTLSDQARDRTLAEIGVLASNGEFPTIIVGDFNAGAPDVMKVLSKFGFQDITLEIHPEWATHESGYTFSSWHRRSRIDLILYRPGDGSDSVQLNIVSAELFGMEGRPHEALKPVGGVYETQDTIFASDHLFVAAEFKLS